MNNNSNDRSVNELGAIWLKTSQKGTKYYSGKIVIDGREIYINMFKNTKKTPGSNLPDWRIVESTYQGNGSQPQSRPQPRQQPQRPSRQQQPPSRPVTQQQANDQPEEQEVM